MAARSFSAGGSYTYSVASSEPRSVSSLADLSLSVPAVTGSVSW